MGHVTQSYTDDIPHLPAERRALDTDLLDKRTERLWESRHHLVLGLLNMEQLHEQIQLDGMSPLQECLEDLRGIIGDLDCALNANSLLTDTWLLLVGEEPGRADSQSRAVTVL